MAVNDPINIFIGSSSMGEDKDIEKVYVNSIMENVSRDVEIHFMRQTNDKDSFWYNEASERWSTPFSGYRWYIPEAMNFKGRAIYTDCDMINFRDMAELIDTDLKGKPLGARPGTRFGGHEFCVMVYDCAKMEEHVVPVSRQKNMVDYHQRMIQKFSGNKNLVEDLDPRWNSLDGDTGKVFGEEIYQLHYTNMATQPWKPAWYTGQTAEHPRQDLADEFFRRRDMLEDLDIDYEDEVKYGVIGR